MTIVFDGVAPSLEPVGRKILSEGRVWSQSGLLKGDLEPFFVVFSTWVRHEE